MNPGVGEETVKGFFGAMKDQPVIMALCLVIFVLLGLIYFILVRVAEARQTQMDAIFANQKAMLEQCRDARGGT